MEQVSPDQAQFLAMLVQIMGAERCIEVGVFHGYSSLAVALVLPEWGRLVACERDERCLDVARKYYERAGVTHKVDVRHGLAMDSLQYLLDNGEGGSYDFAFLDADKRMYHQYYEMLLQLVCRSGQSHVCGTIRLIEERFQILKRTCCHVPCGIFPLSVSCD
jgi:predicted O-methyltransferase YrrM